MSAPCTRSRDLAVLALAVAMSTAQAQEGRTVLGPLGFSCGMWITPKDTLEQAQLRQWVLGYLSGINMESAGVDFLRDRDIDGLMAWIDDYCHRNPLHAVPQAVYALIKELRSGR